MKPIIFLHDSGYPALANLVPEISKCYLHSIYTVVIVVYILIEYFLYNCRKNSVLAGIAEIPFESVITGLAHVQDIAHNAYRPSAAVFANELKTFPSSHFFRLCAKKPRASLSISLARLVSRSSAYSSLMRRSFSLSGIILLPLPTKASSPRALR